MESLRWILLVAGVVFVLVIFILGKSRRQRNRSVVDELEDDLPEFSAQSLDDVDEGVGEVRIITSTDDDSGEGIVSPDLSVEDDKTSVDGSVNDGLDVSNGASTNDAINDSGADNTSDVDPAAGNSPSDIIILYILAKPDATLLGAEINSSAQAMGFTFGEMNIFHFTRDGRNIFSLANMLEPGSFDAATIHDLKTTGLTVFMQLAGDDPLDDLTEMLQRSYQLAGLLGARLCNHKRAPLTEQDAENYRAKVNDFTAGITPELSTES